MDQVNRAIINIFKEEDRTVKEITDNTVTVDGFREVTYKYKVEDDTIIITNKLGSTVYEKSIRSHQDLDVKVIIEK